MKNILLLVILFSLFSCGSHKYLPGVNDYNPKNLEISKKQKKSLFISSLKLESGEDLSATFQNYLFNSLKSLNIFDEVIMFGSKQNLKNYISVDILITEEIDLHQKSNFRKAYLIGSTLFGSSSFTNFKYDYELKIIYDFNNADASLDITTESNRTLSKKYFSKETPDNLIETVRDDIEYQLIQQIESHLNFFINNHNN